MKRLGLALSAVLTPVFAATPLSPDDVLRLVETQGPREAVSVIWRSPEDAQRFLAGVAAAEARWIEAAQALAPGTDAGAAEELNDAIALALLAKPDALLPWLRTYWWGGSTAICVFGYDNELPGGVDRYIARLKRL